MNTIARMGVEAPDPQIVDRVKAIVRRDLKLGSTAAIADDMPFFGGDVDMDSLDILLLVTSIEKEFGFKVPNAAVGRQVFENVATLTQFIAPQALAANTRTLGWMVPTADSTSGRYFSTRSFGHLGFTGTSIWIDPDRQLFIILLTNRVYPTRANDKIAAVRPAVHDAVVEALGLGPTPR